MRIPEKTAARKFLEDTFPKCTVALLGGSAARGELNDGSDLDILVLDPSKSASFRKCFNMSDWKIEAFVFHPDSFFFALEVSRMEAIPTIPRIAAESVILKDDGSAKDIQQSADDCLKTGPYEWAEDKKAFLRFMISDLLEDLEKGKEDSEKIYTACKLFDTVPEFLLRTEGRWLGYGKWVHRSLVDFDNNFAAKFKEAFQKFIKTGDNVPFITLIDRILEPHGGRLFEGYTDRL
ncbi:nucleotidyltransferase domain-containing protein [Salipaludibacillus aurantiacus]|uniref:Nucleotidyltransferase domain-containing protein n=1 Tax=Salipaludibacillus aurantiacus TaxID=1601833 RepID=A0A1H9S8T0_9BACI|nr:nucleotidyltransferase domain-containing protein [Salipaludibacillus aurantiacus]SER81318.1 Nucleotidyltransferase domain-containing protein [Salipaludibacillus aurantiacus]